MTATRILTTRITPPDAHIQADKIEVVPVGGPQVKDDSMKLWQMGLPNGEAAGDNVPLTTSLRAVERQERTYAINRLALEIARRSGR